MRRRYLVIDLGDQAVHIVLVLHASGKCACRTIKSSRRREKSCQYVREHGTGRYLVSFNESLCRQDLIGQSAALRQARVVSWNLESKIGSNPLALSLIGDKEESLILDHGAAERCPEIVIAKWTLDRGCAVEVIARVHGAVAQELESRTVEVIAPGFRQDVDD